MGIYCSVIVCTFRYVGLQANGNLSLNQSEKENKPEWCKLSKWWEKLNEERIYRNNISDSRMDDSDGSRVDFWWWGSSDGYWFWD